MAGLRLAAIVTHVADARTCILHPASTTHRQMTDQELIDAGVDAIHPIQAKAAGMSAEELKEQFGGKVSFVGGMDTQHLLVNGTREEVKQRVKELRRLFPTGLVISPSHEAVLPDIPPANIAAMFEAAEEM